MTAGRQEEEKERNNVQILMSIEGHEAWSFLVLGLTIVLKIVFSSIEACFSSWLKSPPCLSKGCVCKWVTLIFITWLEKIPCRLLTFPIANSNVRRWLDPSDFAYTTAMRDGGKRSCRAKCQELNQLWHPNQLLDWMRRGQHEWALNCGLWEYHMLSICLSVTHHPWHAVVMGCLVTNALKNL